MQTRKIRPSCVSSCPEFDILQGDLEGGIYLDGESQHLVKQMDFQFPDKTEGSVFIISNVDDLLPEVKSMIREMLFLGVMILLIAGITDVLGLSVYFKPLKQASGSYQEDPRRQSGIYPGCGRR